MHVRAYEYTRTCKHRRTLKKLTVQTPHGTTMKPLIEALGIYQILTDTGGIHKALEQSVCRIVVSTSYRQTRSGFMSGCGCMVFSYCFHVFRPPSLSERRRWLGGMPTESQAGGGSNKKKTTDAFMRI